MLQCDFLRKIMLKLILSYILVFFLSCSSSCSSQYFLVEMDDTQTDHLRAYGLAFFALENSLKVEWLLNFKGGSFLMPLSETVRLQAVLYGVSAKVIDSTQDDEITRIIDDNNMHKVTLEKAPKIAVYTPRSSDPWDDAVTLVKIASEILGGKGGGGRKDFAQAGGANKDKINEVFKAIAKNIN